MHVQVASLRLSGRLPFHAQSSDLKFSWCFAGHWHWHLQNDMDAASEGIASIISLPEPCLGMHSAALRWLEGLLDALGPGLQFTRCKEVTAAAISFIDLHLKDAPSLVSAAIKLLVKVTRAHELHCPATAVRAPAPCKYTPTSSSTRPRAAGHGATELRKWVRSGCSSTEQRIGITQLPSRRAFPSQSHWQPTCASA